MAIPVGRRKPCNIMRLCCKPPDFATEMNQLVSMCWCKRKNDTAAHFFSCAKYADRVYITYQRQVDTGASRNEGRRY